MLVFYEIGFFPAKSAPWLAATCKSLNWQNKELRKHHTKLSSSEERAPKLKLQESKPLYQLHLGVFDLAFTKMTFSNNCHTKFKLCYSYSFGTSSIQTKEAREFTEHGAKLYTKIRKASSCATFPTWRPESYKNSNCS